MLLCSLADLPRPPGQSRNMQAKYSSVCVFLPPQPVTTQTLEIGIVITIVVIIAIIYSFTLDFY